MTHSQIDAHDEPSDTGLPLRSDFRRCLTAAVATVAIAAVWLLGLPWLAEQGPIRRHVDALHAADINASAMFYSELDCRYMLRR